MTDGETEDKRGKGQEADGAAGQVCGEGQKDLSAGAGGRGKVPQVRVEGQRVPLLLSVIIKTLSQRARLGGCSLYIMLFIFIMFKLFLLCSVIR